MASPPALHHQQKHHRYPATNSHANDPPISMNNNGPALNHGPNPVSNPISIPNSNSPDHALHVSFLQPRVAVVLGVPSRWHPLLFIARLLSIVPTLWWGIRCALRFLITELLLSQLSFNSHARSDDPSRLAAAATLPTPPILTRTQPGHDLDDRLARAERSLRLTETALAIVWCWASAYLAFFFTDCLMSRWLINYTPQATIVRLVTLACVFAYATSWVVHLFTGGGGPNTLHDDDPGLLLPAWISIAMILTLCYQATQRKINIRKETRASINAFSYASFISMVALLIHSHCTRASYYGQRYYADIPLVGLLTRAIEYTAELIVKILGVTREMREL